MKRLSKSEVKKILMKHELWLETDGKEGKRAGFFNKDLSGMDFYGRDLRKANFSYASLKNANFRKAKLNQASFSGADLRKADFRGSDLTGAYFLLAKAEGMIYDETTLPAMFCPEKGSFIGYKKAYGIGCRSEQYIVKLRIPVDVKRSSATGNKCRCSKAEVLSITNLDGTKADETEVVSCCCPSFLYCLGETVEVSNFDECRWHECAPGIHFFMSREEAVAWQTI